MQDKTGSKKEALTFQGHRRECDLLQGLAGNFLFLHGELEEEIYMDQPEGFIVPGKINFICKLKKSLYGLKQSPRQWYKRFDSFILLHDFKRSEYDSCVYIKIVDGSPIYLLLYVDDMLIAAKSRKENYYTKEIVE